MYRLSTTIVSRTEKTTHMPITEGLLSSLSSKCSLFICYLETDFLTF